MHDIFSSSLFIYRYLFLLLRLLTGEWRDDEYRAREQNGRWSENLTSQQSRE